jgi:hypothetical protein
LSASALRKVNCIVELPSLMYTVFLRKSSPWISLRSATFKHYIKTLA